MTYDSAFYDTIRPGTKASADVVVPLVCDHLSPYRVIDVGCGEGWWARRFADEGCDVVGVDGAYVPFLPAADNLRFEAHDLAQPLPRDHYDPLVCSLGSYDLVVSLEVAEHLPPHRAAGFVDDLCSLAGLILFSAAIPGQGGSGHLNEQWPAYWVALFEARGYTVSGALRWQIWGDPRVENWYQQNMLVFSDSPEEYPALFDTPMAGVFPLVHPILFDARRSR